jgi:hypothetical protein
MVGLVVSLRAWSDNLVGLVIASCLVPRASCLVLGHGIVAHRLVALASEGNEEARRGMSSNAFSCCAARCGATVEQRLADMRPTSPGAVMNNPNAWTMFDQLQHRDPASLTRDERLVLALGEIRTEVNSGGFDFYLRYPHRENTPFAVEAAREAGCPALAALIEEAIALVGPHMLLLDDEDALYDRLEQVEDDLGDLDQRFYDLEKTADLDAALSRLVARVP